MVQAAYPSSDYDNTTMLMEQVLRDFFFLCPSSRAMLALDAYGVSTYLYQFVYHGDWIEDPYLGE
jgi:carboxylesterase type B